MPVWAECKSITDDGLIYVNLSNVTRMYSDPLGIVIHFKEDDSIVVRGTDPKDLIKACVVTRQA